MKKVNFIKYSATGNDFILIDNRQNQVKAEDHPLWQHLCERKNGIGADGVLLVEKSNSTGAQFRMRYLNADGGEVEMCGNGGRTICYYAYTELGHDKKEKVRFQTKNGLYVARWDLTERQVHLRMAELYDIGKIDLSDFPGFKNALYLNTGVPHAIFEVDNIETFPVVECGRAIRHDPRFAGGTNASFFQMVNSNEICLRTYERGVEDETLACGTGATAAAIMVAKTYGAKVGVTVRMKGGTLSVQFDEDFREIYLCGKVEKIFSGKLEI
ncbi:MAG: diaminopimelate epimerase [Pseudomonadota bacterium]